MIADEDFSLLDPIDLLGGTDLRKKLLQQQNFSLFGLSPNKFEPRFHFGSPYKFGRQYRHQPGEFIQEGQ